MEDVCSYDLVGEEIRYVVNSVFFFQAEDGIRDIGVTGVQTCALPIYVDVDRGEVLDAPEEVVRELERLLGIALAAEEVRLPRRVVRDARDAVELALVGDGVDVLRRALHDHEVDRVLQDEVARHGARAVRVGLRVLDDDLDLAGALLGLDAVLERLANALEDEVVGLAEAGQRARLRRDVADLQGVAAT